MSKRRPSGDGMVRKRDDGCWEGRIVVGHKENGDSIFRYIYADTKKELTAKLRPNIDLYQGIDLTKQSRMTLAEWLEQWLGQMSATLRPSTLEHYQKDMASILHSTTRSEQRWSRVLSLPIPQMRWTRPKLSANP